MRLLELLCPLAAACDAGACLPPDTAQRTALIGWGLGRALGFSRTLQSDLVYAGLLRHLGCSVTAHEETRLMGDEQELRGSFNGIDVTAPAQILKRASKGFARGRPRLERVRTVAAFMVNAPRQTPRIFGARCEVSGRLGQRLGMSAEVVRALDEVYERFDGKGLPKKRSGEMLSPLSAVLAVAELVAMYLRLPGGEAVAFELLERRSGGEFDPEIVRALKEARDAILESARLDAPQGALLDAEPEPRRRVEDPRAVALVLADFADLKSTYTLGHSRKVAELARRAAEAMGLPAEEVARVELAGLVHDVGRVSVSNAIWDKPGPLDVGEWDKVRAHPEFTERVLRTAEPFQSVSRLAASDHERLNGEGYPRGGLPSVPGRLLAAADVVQALLEPRPHRSANPRDQAFSIAIAEAEAGRLDRTALNAVLEAAGETRQRAEPPAGLTLREIDVLRLLARGLVDKEIAALLGISHRTVHHHNQSVFGKLQVSTRGAAALFAIENGLV